jgi:Cu2+-exporting ATPase
VARWFVLALILIAAGVGFAWWQIEPARMLPVVLSVLVVTCPCALSLATPAALAAATAALSRSGLLITRTATVENLARADAAVFDKTGTLSLGEPVLRAVSRVPGRAAAADDDEQVLALAAALEGHSRHPLAAAFAPWQGRREATDVDGEVGRGIEGTVDGRRLRMGRLDYVAALAGAETPEAVAAWGACLPAAPAAADGPGDAGIEIYLGDGDGALARFVLEDALRPDAAATVQALCDRGVEALISSGDGEGPVRRTAARVGVADARWRQRPQDKLALIRSLQGQGRVVAMVGDGINDAPVLAGADVSVALPGGADLARVSADMVLLGERLQPLAQAVDHARRTVAIIRQNLLWAVAYNVIALPLAAGGLIAPWMAAIGMSLSSLVVVGNALRLRRLTPVTMPAIGDAGALPDGRDPAQARGRSAGAVDPATS